ncbi:MAG: hypothetical protein WCO44_01175 [Bacteroidota bacterium]
MKKRAIMFDPDNTIYPVGAISERLFGELSALVESDGEFAGDMERITATGANRKTVQLFIPYPGGYWFGTTFFF